MSESTVRIGLVLPDVMGTYGDGGNALILRQRLRMRGYDAEVVEITLGDPVPESLDVYTLGGAEDSAQRLATRHLTTYPGLQKAAERGAPVLAICAAIQVLGHWYETSSGERVEGVSMLRRHHVPAGDALDRRGRLTTPLIDRPHRTTVRVREPQRGNDTRPRRQAGGAGDPRVGNGVGDGLEGVTQGSVIGTYMHGPVLARNRTSPTCC
ncbi:glutamine amidotransferase [Rhodococcus hoagii]|nr:glutamine amidotransferase [Prescottella equi]